MKYIFLLITLAMQFMAVRALKLLDNFSIIIVIFVACIGLGAVIHFSKPKDAIHAAFGWGLFYGSLISVGVIAVLMILLLITLR